MFGALFLAFHSDNGSTLETSVLLLFYGGLSYDPYGPARAFIAKLLRKSPYEGRSRWREQGRKKPCGPARIAYGPHTGILSIARTRCELKQLCCHINPDFLVKMIDVSEHSEFYYPKKKKKHWRERKARSLRRDLGSNIFPSGPPTQSISTYYWYMANPVLGKSLCSDWFFLGQDFAVRTVSMEMVQSVYFSFGAKPANSTFATKTAKK